MSKEEVLLFFNGIITGLVQDDDLESVEKCITDVDGLDVEIAAAVSEFKKGGISNIIKGAKEIGDVLASAKADISQCEEMKTDWARIEEWSKIFKNPSQLLQTVVQNAIANRSGIAADISEIKADEKSGNFKDLGLTIADLLTKAIGEVPQSSGNSLAELIVGMSKEEVLLFFNGLLTGLVQDDDLETVEKCITDVDGLDVEIAAAVSEFKKGGIHNIITGAKEIGDVLASAKADISQCEEMKGDWARIESWSKIFKNPSQLLQTVVQNAIANRSGIAADISELKADEKSGNFKDLGLTVADLLTKAIGEVPRSANNLYLY